MDYMEIEVKAKTEELAVEAAMIELGVDDREDLQVEVITEPVKGFLGMGGQDGVFRVTKRAARKGRRRGRDRGASNKKEAIRPQDRVQGAKNGDKRGQSRPAERQRTGGKHLKTEQRVSDDRPTLSIEEQAKVVKEFLEGLVEAYGLEGSVTARVDDDVIVADVEGDQTEALVGVRGSVRAAIHELTRTVLQRYSQETSRLRLDIAGYAERRRKALTIYAEQLIEQLMDEGGEIMLEPMSPADRKVIHDVAALHASVTSYSEGEPPRRYVVLSRVDDGEEE